nr:galactokinase family protein [bacterium]
MPFLQSWRDWIDKGQADEVLARLYGQAPDAVAQARKRYQELLTSFEERFGQGRPVRLFSAPGRSEIGGNHTDHNHGRVLAAAVTVDMVAAAAPRQDNCIVLYSQGYSRAFMLELGSLEPQVEEKGTSLALIRGVAAQLKARGLAVGGFDACVCSNVFKGSGLSSSAAFEVLISRIFEGLYNPAPVDGLFRAQAAQTAENVYFGKPCGLMDQTACSLGAMITIDFKQIENPAVRCIHYDFAAAGYSLAVVNTPGNHAALTGEYAAVREEMQQVAGQFGADVLRDVPEGDFIARMPELRSKVSDRALLRAMHFYGDNARVARQVEALEKGDLNEFLRLVIASGESSWRLLQNVYVGGETQQALALALAESERMLAGRGAWRVHGGGFAGTIQAFVPNDLLDAYRARMDALFGAGACCVLGIRDAGAIEITMQGETTCI